MTRSQKREMEVLKQLLIAESAVNRSRLREDLAELRAEGEALAKRLTSVGSLASLAERWLDGACQNTARSAAGSPRRGWLGRMVEAGGLALRFWRAWTEARRAPEQHAPRA